MSIRPEYEVQAERDGKWWVVTVPDVPGAVTQTRRLADVDEWIREAIAFVLQVPEDSFDLTVSPTLPESLATELSQSRELLAEASRIRSEAARAARRTASDLRIKGGLSSREVAQVMGISPQRVHQLLRQPAAVVTAAKTVTRVSPSPGASRAQAKAAVGRTRRKAVEH